MACFEETEKDNRFSEAWETMRLIRSDKKKHKRVGG